MWRAALAALMVAGCIAPFASISRGEIARIESAITMPEGAAPLEAYARFYALDGHLIVGEFLAESALQNVLSYRTIERQFGPRIYIVSRDNLPMVADSGCTLSYERDTRLLEGPVCVDGGG